MGECVPKIPHSLVNGAMGGHVALNFEFETREQLIYSMGCLKQVSAPNKGIEKGKLNFDTL